MTRQRPTTSKTRGTTGRSRALLLALLLAPLLLWLLQLDVFLGFGKGQVDGWVTLVESGTRDTRRPIVGRLPANSSQLLVVMRDGTEKPWYPGFTPDLFDRLREALFARGRRPVREVPPGSTPGGRGQLFCRLRYAGLFRKVVYDFEALPEPR